MTFLLDVNVLIALIDPNHVEHDAAHEWFHEIGAASWATCPLTENGVIRVVGHPKYPNSAGSPAAVAPFVARLRTLPGHVFWKDDLSLIGSDLVNVDRIMTPAALAIEHQREILKPDLKFQRVATLHAYSRKSANPGGRHPSAALDPRFSAGATIGGWWSLAQPLRTLRRVVLLYEPGQDPRG